MYFKSYVYFRFWLCLQYISIPLFWMTSILIYKYKSSRALCTDGRLWFYTQCREISHMWIYNDIYMFIKGFCGRCIFGISIRYDDALCCVKSSLAISESMLTKPRGSWNRVSSQPGMPNVAIFGLFHLPKL